MPVGQVIVMMPSFAVASVVTVMFSPTGKLA